MSLYLHYLCLPYLCLPHLCLPSPKVVSSLVLRPGLLEAAESRLLAAEQEWRRRNKRLVREG